jgi:putative hemolysin
MPAFAGRTTQREDGTFLLDAFIPFAEVMQLIGISDVQAGDYVSLAGFVLSHRHELPRPGDHFTWNGWRFEVVDSDGRRIDMILLQRQRPASASGRSHNCVFPLSRLDELAVKELGRARSVAT